ncbi:MAG: hypothetical protein FWE04_01690 [Oscillospiraceae bacterium]|nr:hypothetical protein [Oscillospiraceae bacterium]
MNNNNITFNVTPTLKKDVAGFVDKIIKSTDEKFTYAVDVSFRKTGINSENENIFTIHYGMLGKDEYIVRCLRDDFGIDYIDTLNNDKIYINDKAFQDAYELLSNSRSPEFSDVVIVEDKTIVTEESVAKSLEATGITDPEILEELRKKMLSVNNGKISVMVTTNPYFLGWIFNNKHRFDIEFVVELRDGEKIHTIEAEVKTLEEAFEEWKYSKDERSKFGYFGIKPKVEVYEDDDDDEYEDEEDNDYDE